MKLTIAQKLFLTILAVIICMVVIMQLSIQWSFNRGFSQYVNTLEQERFEVLTERLEGAYAERGNWEFLKGNPVTWATILLGTLPEGSEKIRQRHRLINILQGREPMHMTMMQRNPRPFELRVVLLDADKNRLWGPQNSGAPDTLQAIAYNAETVGYLGLIPAETLTDPRQLDFSRRHKLIMILVAVFVAVVSAVLCIPLARRLAKPVAVLAEGTRALAGGQFDVRIPELSHDEFGQLTKDFNLLAQTLEDNQTARRQWVADISHELRTPLSVLRGEIEALQDGVRSLTPKQLDSLHSEVLHLVRLVDDLYELSMSDIGALNYQMEPVDLKIILDDVLQLFKPRLAEKGLALTSEFSEAATMIKADRLRLQQLLENLMENSLRYTTSGGQILVSLAGTADAVTIDIQDTAPGVSAEEIPRLFERLYRVESARSRESGGAGLGLSICQNIVHAHGGSISAQGSELGGLWITVRLPVND